MFDKGLYFGQYIIAFVIVNMVLPRLIFARSNRTVLSNFFAYFIQMVLLVIVVGYILVILKIFEMVTILCVLLFFIFGRTFANKSKRNHKEMSKEISLWLYDYADGIINLPKLIKRRFSEWTAAVRKSIAELNKTSIVMITASFALFAYSGFLRLYDAFANAAPAMSDSYVTLAWIKYIETNALFHDGIYPQGFHIYQAFLQKFAGLDPLFILKFTGPINGLLIVIGIYFSVSSFLKSKQAGLVAASVYGIFGTFLTESWERQAATNSQEFAFVFILPCLYFFYRYFTEKDKQDLYIGGAALAVIGLVHSLVLAFTLFGGVVLLFAIFVSENKSFKKQPVWNTIGVVALASVFSALPFGIGYLLGHEFHSSSVDFAVSQSTSVDFPVLILSDYVVIACLFLLVLSVIGNRKKPFVSARVFLLLFGTATFCLYYFVGALTDSVLISSRSNELYSLVSPVIIGAGFYCIIRVFARFKHNEFVFSILCTGLILGACIQASPGPVIPYKMEYNSSVEQYLRISKNYRATEWLIVSQEEGYALVLGKGWHLMTQDFLKGYKPENGELIGNDSDSTKINVPDVFLYIEKNIYPTYKNMDVLKVRYERRVRESAEMKQWIAKYNEINGNQEVYFEDENIIIYHMHQAPAQSEITDRVLGPAN